MTKKRPSLRLTVSALAAMFLLVASPDLLAQRGAQGRPSGGGGRPSASRPSRPSASRPSRPVSRPSAPSRSSPVRSAPSRPSPVRSSPTRSAPTRSAPTRSAPTRSSSSSASRASGASAPTRATTYSAPAPLRTTSRASNPTPVRSAVPSRGLDTARSTGSSSSAPIFERSPSRVRFPAPASRGDAPRGSLTSSRSTAGPSASRLRTSSSSSVPRDAAPSRERGASARTRSLAPEDRDAILDRYRRVAPQSTRGVGPSSSRLGAGSRGRSAGLGSSNLAERAALARGKNNLQARTASERLARADQATRGLRDLALDDPVRAGRYERAGAAIGNYTGVGVSVGVSVGLGYWWGGWYGYCYPWSWSAPWYGGGYWGSWWWWNRWSSWPWGGWGWNWWGWGSWPNRWWWPNTYGWYYAPPVYYSTVIYQTAEPVQQPVEAAPVEQVGEGVAIADQGEPDRLLRSGPDSAARASGQYLTLGDRAFRDGRYADAVHFYARAVEFSPNEAVLYLVLSDGLFATGDYHYGAFALRKALELDPTLASSAIDKHEFYTDPLEFDRQLAQLETYLIDHPGDADARLMLGANYLFGGRPAAAVDLLSDPGSDRLLDDAAAALILQAARDAQYGLPQGR